MRYDLVSAPALSGSTAAHMPAICVLFRSKIIHLQQHRLGQYLFWEAQLGKADRKSRKKRHPVRVNGLLSTKARSGKYYLSRMMKPIQQGVLSLPPFPLCSGADRPIAACHPPFQSSQASCSSRKV